MTEHARTSMNYRKASLFFLGVITLIMTFAALKLTTPVVLPFLIAVLLTFVLEPLVSLLVKVGIPRAVAAVVIVLLMAVMVYFLGLILYNSLRTIATLYPKYEVRFTEIYIMLAETFQLPYDEHLNLFENLWNQLDVRLRIQTMAFRFSETFLSFLGDVVMVVLFVVFLLLEVGHFRERAEKAFAGMVPGGITSMVSDVVRQVTRYLSIKFFLSLATGLIVGIALSIIGMDFPVVWAVITFMLNFIPTLGSIVAGFGVGIFALVQFYPDPVPIIAAASVMLLVNMAIGNILEPKVQGDNLGLSPFIILVSLLAWGWLWGFAGMVLAVPMTVIVKIICEKVPALEPMSIMMGSVRAMRQKEINPEGDATGV